MKEFPIVRGLNKPGEWHKQSETEEKMLVVRGIPENKIQSEYEA